jgi:hypothetical protein
MGCRLPDLVRPIRHSGTSRKRAAVIRNRRVPRFGRRRTVSTEGMDLKRPLLLLAVAGSLVACGGDNTNFQRGETNCDAAGEEASNPQDASCEETGTPG